MTHGRAGEYYRSGNVVITSSRAEFAGKTYAMANVTSVKMEEVPPDRGCATWLAILGAIGLFGGCAALSEGVDGGGIALLAAIALIAAGGFWLYSLKPTYKVVLGSAWGEVSAMESPDQGDIASIINAIKKAIVERG
jgi:hypothetical protein